MLSRNTKTVAVIAATLFGVTLAGLLVFVVLLQKQEALLQEKHQALKRQQVYEQELVSLLELVSNSAEDRSELNNYLLGATEEDVVELLGLIETIGREQGVALKTSSISVTPKDDTFARLTMAISLEGSYPLLTHMITLLENLPYQSKITTVTLSRGSETSNTWTGSLNLEVTQLNNHD